MADGAFDSLLPVDLFYDYRGRPGSGSDAPPIWLPVHQGDVFEGVAVPGVPASDRDDPQLVMVFMHPCTMRKGAVLNDPITVFQVRTESTKKNVSPETHMRWYSRMPLLDLRPPQTSTHIADFMHVGVVSSEALDRAARISSLSADGRQLVQQRVIHHLTRLAVPLHDLAMQTRGVERELELQATWCEHACERHGETASTVSDAEVAFDLFMTQSDRRARLDDDAGAHQVIAEVNREARSRYSSGRS